MKEVNKILPTYVVTSVLPTEEHRWFYRKLTSRSEESISWQAWAALLWFIHREHCLDSMTWPNRDHAPPTLTEGISEWSALASDVFLAADLHQLRDAFDSHGMFDRRMDAHTSLSSVLKRHGAWSYFDADAYVAYKCYDLDLCIVQTNSDPTPRYHILDPSSLW